MGRNGSKPLTCHVTGNISLFKSIGIGGATYFVRNGNLSTWFEDISLVRPTALIAVPRILSMVVDRLRGQLEAPGAKHQVRVHSGRPLA